MPPSSGELWGHHLMPQQIDLDCLLPNGILVPLLVNRDAMLSAIKDLLWSKLKLFPLSNLIAEQSSYIFVSVAQDAKLEEFYDETRRLCDLRLFQPFLKLVEPEGNREEKILNSEIGLALGTPVTDFDELKDIELVEFRHNLMYTCKEAVDHRHSFDDLSDVLYFHPPDVETGILPANLQTYLDKDEIILCIWLASSSEGQRQKYSIKVMFDATPDEIIVEVLKRKSRGRNPQMLTEQKDLCAAEYKHRYILKVCGCEQYVYNDYQICQFKYIRMCIGRRTIPQLMLMSKDTVLEQVPHSEFTMPSFLRRGFVSPHQYEDCLSLWRLHVARFRVKVLSATYVNAREFDKIYVKVGLYHGQESLCEMCDTQQVPYSNPKWNRWLDFDLYIPDLPRSARICVSLCSVCVRKKKGKLQEEHVALGWGNLNLFDYKSVLRSDKVSLHLWPLPEGMEQLVNPLGVVGSNPNKDTTCLEIEFDRFNHTFCYPSQEEIEEYAMHIMKLDATARLTSPNLAEIDQLREISSRDPLSELSEQDKELLWLHRHYLCEEIPTSLPKLILATKWSSRDEVSQIYMLLRRWAYIDDPVIALSLLDCMYADLTVREFAVTSLQQNLSVDRLAEILLQLIQVLKYEPYADNALARYLTKQALSNRQIGHFFFWHIKSEMQYEVTSNYPYSLLLECYCRGCGANLKVLTRQVEALDKLAILTDELRELKDESFRKKYLYEQVTQTDYLEALQNFPSPLNNNYVLGKLNVEECRVLTSARRPLWLVWNNANPTMTDAMFQVHEVIFKNGDDLRQDMLTLQVIQIMDRIWKNEGMDLRMMPYGCLSTGKKVGVIEVVKSAETVYGIQKKGGTGSASQVHSKQLHRWIKEKNKGDKYERAIDLFTQSCAGYCVATFVLGIQDRHPQNIMVTEEGQIFHIDFGHILGHSKKKFGIRRERVPFVLTEDFIRVIAKGADNPQRSKAFENFQEMCGKAYIRLRKHSHLLITLFTMMLSAGIPELQTLEDVDYLRKTLAVDLSEQTALEYFQAVFNEAYNGAWTAKVDWFFHFVRHL